MVEIKIQNIVLQAETKSDLFSPKRFDIGSKMLAEYVLEKTYNSVLDWGCGWGALSLVLAANNPRAHVTALDANIGAVSVSRKNAQENHLNNITVLVSDSYSELDPDVKFDLIVSHPPTHLGREIVEHMITSAPKHLEVGGELAIVVEARLKPWVARVINDTFKGYKIVKRGPKHVVLSAKNKV